MSTELNIKVIDNTAPVTLAEAVYLGDGTSKTLKEELESIKNNNTGGSTSVNIAGRITPLLGGTVKIFIDLDNKKVSWSSGIVLTDNEKITVSEGSFTFTAGECNTGNPTYAYVLIFDGTTFKWKTINSSGNYGGYGVVIQHYSDGNYGKTEQGAITYLLNYPEERLCIKGSNVMNSTIPMFSKMAILGDSLSSGGTWSRNLQKYTYIPTIDCLAKSGATMSTQGTGTVNIADGQVNSVTADTDLTIIFAGTNDGMFNATVDEFVESPTNGNASFTESYQYTIEKLLTINPKMKIYLVTPMFTLGKTYGDKSITYNSNKSMRDAVISIGQHYSLPVLDLFYESGVNKFNSTTYQTDGVHGTEIGYRIICDKIWKFICSK